MREILVLIVELTQVSGLRFVGGTSLFIQGYKSVISDIDVVVPNLDEISKYFRVEIINEPLFKFTNRRRAFFIRNDILVDIMIDENTEETTIVNGRVCTTIDSEIAFKERMLSLNLNEERRKITMSDINYLKEIKKMKEDNGTNNKSSTIRH